ncbi:ABC transporter ATP-binding protein [Marinicella litoralis]|uniref:ABC-2 type transport system ATP-binding protein n=1 Tax=Marinicella litoralis TaxID=644220 RepID=A0A4R6XZ15_9GAMM|nr:ABC transporter ATP-binding protein [Marinicella litoralis]TDR23574.1 ABC-2 type transport system ATP-binding protein [Marinicella litoralis]
MSDFAFQMHQVAKQYPHFQLQNIDLQLPNGGIMGLIGPNGAGKSTLIRILMGLIAADKGTTEVLGHNMPNHQALAKVNIGFVSEDMRLYKNATLQWHMDFIQRIYPEQWNQKYAVSLLSKFDLISEQKIKGMSHGQRVKSSILLMLARQPKLLIFDEPTTGLDPVARKEVLNEMMVVLNDEDRSILFSSHNTQDVEQLSDQITFIDRGEIVSSDDKESFIENWRRIRLHADSPLTISVDQHVKEVINQGRNTTLIMHQFNESMLRQWTQQGAVVKGVEYMSLEEIFVAEVEAKRSGVAA